MNNCILPPIPQKFGVPEKMKIHIYCRWKSDESWTDRSWTDESQTDGNGIDRSPTD